MALLQKGDLRQIVISVISAIVTFIIVDHFMKEKLGIGASK